MYTHTHTYVHKCTWIYACICTDTCTYVCIVYGWLDVCDTPACGRECAGDGGATYMCNVSLFLYMVVLACFSRTCVTPVCCNPLLARTRRSQHTSRKHPCVYQAPVCVSACMCVCVCVCACVFLRVCHTQPCVCVCVYQVPGRSVEISLQDMQVGHSRGQHLRGLQRLVH